jgi:hypothetical protein
LIFGEPKNFKIKVVEYIKIIQELRSKNTTFNKIIAIKDKIVRFPSTDNLSVDVEKYKSVMLENKTLKKLLEYDTDKINLLNNFKYISFFDNLILILVTFLIVFATIITEYLTRIYLQLKNIKNNHYEKKINF